MESPWTPLELADIAIAQVELEPLQPSGLGARNLIAGLFEQYAAKAVAAERERCAKIADDSADDYDPDDPYTQAAADVCRGIAKDIREGAR